MCRTTISEAEVVSVNVCLMIVLCSVPLRQRTSHFVKWLILCLVRCGSTGAEHVTAIAHVIVRHVKLAAIGLESGRCVEHRDGFHTIKI